MRITGPSAGFSGTITSQEGDLPLNFDGSKPTHCMIQGALTAARTHFGFGPSGETVVEATSLFVNNEADPVVVVCSAGSNDKIFFLTDVSTSAIVVTPVEL